MKGIDVNCLWGNWPFRKLYKNKFEDLLKIHSENGIVGGYVSCMNSIFYNDPFEGEADLHEILQNSGSYHQLLTINPTLPAYESDVETGVRLFDIQGIRIYPGYHNYRLGDECMKKLCALLRKYRLPLMLTMRLEDERLNYICQPRQIAVPGELLKFVESVKDIPVLIMNLRYGEILSCEDAIRNQPNLYIDTSGIKDPVASLEEITKHIGDRKIIYGSQYPLNALKSTLYEVTMAEISGESKERILYQNAAEFFSFPGK